MSSVCFDNHVLIWGIKEQASEGQEENIANTKRFINELADDTKVIIPSIVMAEFLLPIPPKLHATVINLFSKLFIIAPFDTYAASKLSLVWQAFKNPEIAKRIEEEQRTRAELRADAMIVATALAQRADCIYSQDRWLKTFANGFIDVKEVPFTPIKLDMFELNPDI